VVRQNKKPPHSHMWRFSYVFLLRIGTLGGTRTHDPLVRNQVLYPLSYEGAMIDRTYFTPLRNACQA
jgi:hypothetical protein